MRSRPAAAHLALWCSIACQPVTSDAGSELETRPEAPRPAAAEFEEAPTCRVEPSHRLDTPLTPDCWLPGPLDPSSRWYDDCVSRVVPKVGVTRLPLRWTLKASSPLLPGLRIYGASDRYPGAFTVDFAVGSQIGKIDVAQVNLRLRERGRLPSDEAEIHELARFIVIAKNSPYDPEQIVVSLEPRADAIMADIDYEKSTPWSPAWHEGMDPGLLIRVGSKTARFRTHLAFHRDGCIEDLGTEETEVILVRL